MALKRFLFVTDSHGDQIDDDAAKAALDFASDWKPHVRIHGGDVMDLRPIRRGASNEEQAENMLDDVQAGINFLKRYFSRAGKSPKQENVLTLGNHDYRLWDLAQSSTAGLKAEYAFSLSQRLEELFAKLKITWLPYHVRRGVYKLGDLSFIHGYRHNLHCAKTHAEIYGSCIFGHVHRFSEYALAHTNSITAMSCGSLAQLDMPYAYNITNSLSHEVGFIFGVVNEKTGSWEAWKVRRNEQGQWLNPRTI